MYCGYIVELQNLHKHSNADRLQCTEIFGNNVIFDMSYHNGQKVVFFPTDGQLNEDYARKNNLLREKDADGKNTGGYLDPDKRNIRAIKLRGEKSEGLALPIETLSDYVDINTLSVGTKITSLGGVCICQKYIPKRQTVKTHTNSTSMKKGKSNHFPLFQEHVDTEQLAYNKAAFKPGDRCTITLKLHGSSGRSSHSLRKELTKQNFFQKLLHRPVKETMSWDMVTGTRRCVLEEWEGGYYGDQQFRKKWHDFLSGKLEKGETLYYEIVGWVNPQTTIMPIGDNKRFQDKEIRKLYGDKMIFSYGCDVGENDIYAYRMTITNEDGYTVEYPDWLMRLRCEMMGVKCVPLFETFTFTTWEDLMARVEKYYDGPDPIGKTHVREGVVVRIENRPKFEAYKHKNFTFKVNEGLIKETAQAPDMEEAEEVGDGAGEG